MAKHFNVPYDDEYGVTHFDLDLGYLWVCPVCGSPDFTRSEPSYCEGDCFMVYCTCEECDSEWACYYDYHMTDVHKYKGKKPLYR